MRDFRARAVVVGLVLGFPFLVAASGRREVSLPAVVAVETVLAVGLTIAARERGRLLSERAPSTSARGTYVGPRTPLAHLRAARRVAAGR